MNIRVARPEDAGRWNSFLFSSPLSSFLQTWEWGTIQEEFGTHIHRYILEDNGATQLTALVLERALPLGRSWLYIPRGPIVKDVSLLISSWQMLQEKLFELAAKKHIVFVRIDPAISPSEWPHFATSFAKATAVKKATLLRQRLWKGMARGGFSFRKSEREVQPRHTLLLDLSPQEENLLSNMRSKTRYNIRLAQRKGVQVRFSTSSDDITTFLRLSQEVAARSSFRFHPDAYYNAILQTLGRSDPAPGGVAAELALAEHEGEVLAAHLMVYSGNTATYVHGASTLRKKHLMAPTYLYWQTIQRAKELGFTTYDFFGVAPPDADEHHPWYGVTRVKTGFGGQRLAYAGAYDYILDPLAYHAIAVAKRMRDVLR